MADLKLGTDGDLDLTGGSLSLVTGGERIAQQIKIRLRMFLGEWFLDTRQGLPYYQEILRKGASEPLIASRLRAAIITTPGVVTVKNLALSLDRSTRVLSVSFEAIGDGTVIPIFEGFILS